MSAPTRQTVVLFSGLPYTGKTAIIHRLQDVLPGEAIHVDVHFRDIVAEDEVCLKRWLEENPRLVDRIIEHMRSVPADRYYVEIGIMRKKHRRHLIEWSRSVGYDVLPVLLECHSREAIAARQEARMQALALSPEKQKIAIDLDELYGPIASAFEKIEASEGYHVVDTSKPIDVCVNRIVELIGANGASGETDRGTTEIQAG
ncbi:MAG: ATP-binding protein [Burkholderiaceae bacterium]|nr:ATP-binding protein [Burkholderiaceae bacterium]